MPEGITLKRIIDMDETEQLSSSDYVLVDSASGGNRKYNLGEDLNNLKDDFHDSLVTDTASGAIASFPDGADGVPVKSLAVDIEPVQDLHGQDSPYHAGGGKNLIPLTVENLKSANTNGTWNGNVYTFHDLTFTVQVDSAGNVTGVLINGTASSITRFFMGSVALTSGTSYTVTGFSGTGNTFFGNINPAFASSSDANITSKTTGTANENKTSVVSFYVLSGVTLSNMNLQPMLRVSSNGDDTFAPYENICPISGHDMANVTRTGKNLLAKPFVYYSEASATLDDCFFIKAGQYIFHFDSTSATSWRFCIRLMDKNGNFLSDIGHRPSEGLFYNNSVNGWLNGANITIKQYPFTIVEDCFIRIVFAAGDTSASTTVTGAQLEIGSTATAYEPYNGQTYTIDLNGTIYGATLNVETGVLTVNRAGAVLNDPDKWVVSPGTTTTYQYDVAFANRKFYADSFTGLSCSMMPVNSHTVRYTARWIGASDGTFGIAFSGENPELTLAQIKTLASNGDISIAYDIEPQTIQLTAQEVRTLLGQNNVFSDCGDVDVEYRADTKLYINKVLNA